MITRHWQRRRGMPREMVHWMVAERAAELLASSPYGPALNQCPNGLRYGAVFPDVLFYLRGDYPEALLELPQRLHGAHGEDTYDLLRLYAPHMYSMRSMALPTAFFVGLVAHIFADATIHPLVYHFTGNYYDVDPVRRTTAIRRHRILEALFDMVAAGGQDKVAQSSFKAVVAGVEGPLSLACPPEILGTLAGVDAATAIKGFRDALDSYGTMQALCRMPTLAKWVREFEGWLPDKGREIAALFYAPQLWDLRASVNGALTFRNPFTGEVFTQSLAGLMELAARQTAWFCTTQAPGLIARGGLAETAPGPSLDMGIASVDTSQAKYFASRTLPPE
ncbi:MAG: hypothetical protein CVU73_03605 [Deltaproteobacteria bacterium HGW-Deltaproteobacteria-8]|jgi:hypothetical protein|nr:MAG: hypothetical protein CVU73_03605 [Deltaproteobacteria bacterium HGW-Deltaproteobacteria-8]